jgi:hypothetical protein
VSLLGLALMTAPAQAEVVRRALLVGANDGGVELPGLQYTGADVQKMRDVLVELGGFEPENVVILTQPDSPTLEVELQALPPLEEDDLFLFYYSGHADARGLRLGDEIYAFDDLRTHFERIDADVKLGVLDACRSGQITANRAKGAMVVDPFMQDSLDAVGEAWITASSGDEVAQESSRINGSFFTHHLVSGMRGAADNGDGVVSLSEAYSYAYAKTVETTAMLGGTQHPEYEFDLAGQGDLILTTLSEATSHVKLKRGYGGSITVLTEDYVLIAQVDKPASQEVVLALPPGKYRLRRRDDGEIYEVRLTVAEGSSHVLDNRWGQPVTAIAGTAKGVADIDAGGRSLDLARGAWSTATAIDWRHNPYLAAGFSVPLAGGGQIYNGQYLKGGAMLVGTWALVGAGWGAVGGESGAFKGSALGPSAISLAGFQLWGFSVAQAYDYPSRQGQVYEFDRPRTGVLVGWETSWADDWQTPYSSGLTVDWQLHPNVSIGLDRVGFTRSDYDSGVFNMGARAALGPDWKRFRPHAFASSDLRVGRLVESQDRVRGAMGGGVGARLYLSPRYYIVGETRYELDGGVPVWSGGGGLGVHLGG